MYVAIFHYGQEAHDPRPMSHIHFGYPKALTKQKGTSIFWDAKGQLISKANCQAMNSSKK